MEVNLILSKDILDLEKELGSELLVAKKLNNYGVKKIYVFFKKLESIEGGLLVRHLGEGYTIDEALKDYADKISCRRIVFDFYTSYQKEFQLRKIVHTKLLGY